MNTIAAALIALGAIQLLAEDQSSIEKQRSSVRKQVRAVDTSDAFFTTPFQSPWSTTPAPAALSWSEPQGDCETLPSSALTPMIAEASQREGVDPKLIQAVVKRESGGKPCAVSTKGAQGLMQLMPATQADLGLTDPFDAASNLAAGVKYLKQMLTRYSGNTALALAAYNAGPQRVSPGGKIPDIAETQAYVTNILGSLNQEDKPE